MHPRDNDLVIGTHGLGIWIMDDIGPLEHLSSEVMASSAHLYPVRRATSYNQYTPQGWTPGIYAAPNPPDGARIRYHLGAATDSVKITVTDGGSTVVRELDGTGDAGLNEVIWDLRLAVEGGDGEAMDPGPRVLPGSYTVALAAGGDAFETTAEVRLDPRVELSRSDLMARHAAMMDSYRLSGAVSDARDRMSTMSEQLGDIEERVAAAAEAPEELTKEIDAFREDLGGGAGGPWFGGLRRRPADQRGRLALAGPIEGGPAAPPPPISSGRSTVHGRRCPPWSTG